MANIQQAIANLKAAFERLPNPDESMEIIGRNHDPGEYFKTRPLYDACKNVIKYLESFLGPRNTERISALPPPLQNEIELLLSEIQAAVIWIFDITKPQLPGKSLQPRAGSPDAFIAKARSVEKLHSDIYKLLATLPIQRAAFGDPVEINKLPNVPDDVGPSEETDVSSDSTPDVPSDPGVNRESIKEAGVSDKPTTEDTLGFKPYVEAIARFLLNDDTSPPLSLSIEGEWGSGKSSFMMQLEKAIKATFVSKKTPKDKIFTVWFNAWRHDKGEALWAAFALGFIDQISKSMSFWQRLNASWKLAKARYDWTAGWWEVIRCVAISMLWITLISSAFTFWLYGGWKPNDLLSNAGINGLANDLISNALTWSGIFGGIGAVCYIIKGVNSVVGNPLKHELKKHLKSVDYTERVAFVEKFHRDFSKIVKAYSSEARVFVFVDDLDRCEVETSAELLQALNLMIAEDNPLIFILGLDRAKVAAGLAARAKPIIPYLSLQHAPAGDNEESIRGLEYGLSFIEKFIQLPFRVPQPGKEDLNRFLDGLRSKQKQYKETSVVPKTRDAEFAPTSPRSVESKETPSSPGLQNDLELDEEKRWTGFELRVAKDSETILRLIEMVAPSLDYNPRRLKHFINSFRLKAYICFDTGLFNPKVAEMRFLPLTFEQLGKFVVISLRWPLLLNDLYQDPLLLTKLASYRGLGEISAVEQYWRLQGQVLDLIRWGTEDIQHSETHSAADLRNVDVTDLLRCSPRVKLPNFIESGANDAQNIRSRFSSVDASFRIISGTISPDKNFAFGWGFPHSLVDWTQYFRADGTYCSLDQSQDIRNYIVDLSIDRAIFETAGKHFGDKKSYGHRVNQVAWSTNSRIAVELNQSKWATNLASIYWILSEGRIAHIDILNTLEKALKKSMVKYRYANSESVDTFAFSFYEPNISNEGVLFVQAGAEIPKSSDPHVTAELLIALEIPVGANLKVKSIEVTILTGTQLTPSPE